MTDLDLAELERIAKTATPGLWGPGTILALLARVREAEARIEKVLNHDPLHGAEGGLHCGGMAPCIRRILTEGDEQ